MKRSKKYRQMLSLIDRRKRYFLDEAIGILKKMKEGRAETVSIAMKLGIDPKRTDQTVKGSCVLPAGLGKTRKVLVFAKGEKEKEAVSAGADIVGADDIIAEIKKTGNVPPVDVIIATPDMMSAVSGIGKVLGPRGLMPNPKLGTVTQNVAKAVSEAKMGRVEFKNDRGGCVHAPCGVTSHSVSELVENIKTIIKTVEASKPPSAKGVFIRSLTLSPTQGPGIKVDVASIFKKK